MHVQDRLLVAEALVAFKGSPTNETPRQRRAWELAADLLAENGLGMDALVEDVDEEWAGPSGENLE